MANDFGNQGLEGPEIIEELVSSFRKALKNDGIFRPQDSYSRGYSAQITYHVDCYGLDKESAGRDLVLGTKQDAPDAETADGVIDIPQEEDLQEVRDRMEEAKQQEEEESEEDFEEEPPVPPTFEATKQKRKYTRKVKLAASGIVGGAEEFQE